MFWKKKKIDNPQESKVILGMILLQDTNTFNIAMFCKDFLSFYGETIHNQTGDNSAFIFRIDGEMIAIAHMPVPIPSGDIEGTAQYAYNWDTAIEDTAKHKSHLLVSIMQGGQDQIKRFKIFTKVICSLLRTTNSIGVYKGTQSLLIPTKDYLSEAELMSGDHLPINLWIYFGLRTTEKGKSGYTYGLKQFNKAEMEILNSSKAAEDIREFLFNISHYVLAYDVTFKDGETCGVSEEERIAISISRGKFVEGESVKLSY